MTSHYKDSERVPALPERPRICQLRRSGQRKESEQEGKGTGRGTGKGTGEGTDNVKAKEKATRGWIPAYLLG